ncbi:hypothetical protein ACS15_1484 [Ralstonia insidiosa]|uniref:Uncharacterized protein n=1 Tax=Ralstonia insidiosa TaxID=190721 RepID=A0AAC9FRD1_9RALS|nr:hypothetical protein ACS15_1484 [Ralstonia insidiosa]
MRVETGHASTAPCCSASRANAERARFLTGFFCRIFCACACRRPPVWASIDT